MGICLSKDGVRVGTIHNESRKELDMQFACVVSAMAAYEEGAENIKKKLDNKLNEPMLPKFGSIEYFNVKQTDTQAFVAGNDSVVIVSFRGTEPTHITDDLTDFKMTLVEDKNLTGKVHKGFQESVNSTIYDENHSLLDVVRGRLDALIDGKKRDLWITGHSLGAALATLAASIFRKEGLTINYICTFGSPRVGNEDYVTDYNKNFASITDRFVNHHDIIPHNPAEG